MIFFGIFEKKELRSNIVQLFSFRLFESDLILHTINLFPLLDYFQQCRVNFPKKIHLRRLDVKQPNLGTVLLLLY